MNRTKIVRISVAAFLMICVLWSAIPKIYVHDMLGHIHGKAKPNTETKVDTKVSEDCDFEKYDTPVYFTIFKFISNFISLKPKQGAFLLKAVPAPDSSIIAQIPSRAPPTV